LSVCLYIRLCISETTRPQNSVGLRVAYGHGSIFRWCQYNTVL